MPFVRNATKALSLKDAVHILKEADSSESSIEEEDSYK